MNKLLQINSVANTGSTGRIAEEIGNLVISNGWKSYIAFGRYGNRSSSELIRIGSKFDNYLHVFITRLFDKHGHGSKRATRKLIKQIDNINPDIIHLHNIHGYYINIRVLFNYLSTKSIPIVWTLHDCWAFTGHCVHFEGIGCDKWKMLCSKCPITNSYPKSLVIDNSKRNFLEKKELFNSTKSLTLVPVSFWLQNLVESSFLKNNMIKTIHNGIDLTKFNYKKNQSIIDEFCIQEKFVILGVASFWGTSKGLYDFIDFSKRISEDEIIILVGLKKEQITGLPDNIIGVKKTQSIQELCEFYSIADVFVNPTYEDSFGMVNIEALACGTPVITYNTGGSPETISEETGFVVEKGNHEDMLKCIQQVKKLSKKYFTEACRERAENLFDKNLKYWEYLDLYNEQLNQ